MLSIPRSFTPADIDSRSITMGDFIGKGHFGEVYKGILHGHTFCALKKVRSRSESSEKQENVLRQQLNDEVGQPAT